MNIMLFSRILAKTGVGNHINQLSDALQKIGHRVIVVSGTKDIELQNPQVDFFCVDTLSRNPFRVIKTVFQLRKIIKEQKIDIVHCHHRVAAIYMKLCRLICRVPFVYTLHLEGVPFDFFHRKMTFVGEKAIGVSSEVSEFLVKKLRIPAQKVVTVLNGVDESKLLPLSAQEKAVLHQKWDISCGKTVIALHSRIAPVKNHMLVVEAIARLAVEERQRIVVVCSGEKNGEYYEKVCDAIKERELEDIFRFVGWCSPREILGIADLLILPSLIEGFGLNVSEAFFMRVPVARTETAGFRDLKYCIPISKEDPEDIVGIVRGVLEKGNEQFDERVDEAYQFACETLSCARMAENTLKVYCEVLQK